MNVAALAEPTARSSSTGGEYEHSVTQIRITRALKSRSGARMARACALEFALIEYMY